MEGDVVRGLAPRLGLVEPHLVDKAIEYERISKLRMPAANASDAMRAVVCLDYAAAHFNLPFDTEAALRLCGARRKPYFNFKNNVGRLLGIAEEASVDGLCVRLGCAGARRAAADLFAEFVRDRPEAKRQRYACVAVYKACKSLKIKISKGALSAMANVKPSEWRELEKEWDKAHARVSKAKPIADVANDMVNSRDASETDKDKYEIVESRPVIEDYETWKKRILESAFKDVNLPASLLKNH